MDQKKQAQMKQQIAAFMRRKDYYDVLGVQKTAQLIQIKKAYKKLALRFHPDKNRVEGAKQVFKKVSNAYTTLSNAEKRQRYDRYGPQDNQPPPRQRGYAYRGGRDQQFDQFDQVFRAFFGGGNIRFNQNQYQNFFFHTGGPRQHPQQPRQQQGTFNFGWIFFVFIMIYMVSPLFKSKPQFQLTPSAEYRFKQGTPLLSAPYYVKQSFFSSVKNDANLKKSIDQTVDHNFVLKLDQACDSSTRIKKSYQRQGYYYGAGATRQAFLRKAAQVDMSACIRLQEIKQNHGDYIRNLFYYY